MKTLLIFWRWLRSLGQRRAVKQEIDEELCFHIEARTAENIAGGMSPADAALAARKRFGNVQSVREECREVHGTSFGETVLRDVRFGARMLRKNPGFAAVAVLSLSLGIGAGTAIFSLVNAVLLRSLPVPSPQELRLVHWSGSYFHWASRDVGGFDSPHSTGDSISILAFRALREQCAAQADIFGYVGIGGSALARHEKVAAQGLMVSGNFFSGLGVRPLLGRLLDRNDERAGAAPAVVISYRWWEQQFDLDPGAVGQTVVINGFSLTVVGVLPREFHGLVPGESPEFYVSLSTQPQLMPDDPNSQPNPWVMPLMARIKPGVSDAQFQAALNVAFAHEAESFMKDPRIGITDGRAGPEGSRGIGIALLILLGVVGVVLILACANLAGLMLARGAARQHEFAVRAALGAGRWRLVRQSLTESVLIAFLAGGLGILIAVVSKYAILGFIVRSESGLHFETALDLRVLVFTLCTSLIAALLSGLLPALRAVSVDPQAGLKDRAALGAPRLRAARFLVVAQIALTLLLVGGAGLFVRTLVNLVHINPGFPIDHLLVFELNPADAGYKESQNTAFFERVQQSMAVIPGVRSAALVETPLLAGGSREFGFTVPGHTSEQINISIVSETFFTTIGIPILQGRELGAGDSAGATKVIVVNEAFVRKYFPDRNPIGRMIEETGSGINWQIVGVCRDARYWYIRDVGQPTVHFSFRQYPLRWGARIILRTVLPPLAEVTAVRQAVAVGEPNVPAPRIITQEQLRDSTISGQRTFATLCGLLALLALLLSCIGLYGLMAYHVARHTREIGIRMALGATRRQIAGPILREALVLAGIGMALGAPLTLALTWLVREALYGVGPSDPFTLGGAALLLLLVALAAAWIPARRAARVDPIVAMRYE